MYVKLCVADCWRDPFIARENVRGGQLVSRELNIGSRGRFDDDGKPERGTSLRQCDPELAESRSILGSLSCPPTLSTPPPHLPYLLPPSSFASSLASSDPSTEGAP